jgi:protein-tyrosine kinase
MSRLYEALQRADQDQKKAQALPEEPLINAAVLPVLEEPPADGAHEAAIDDIAAYPWSPSLASFPTLADRGSGVEQFRSLRSRIYQARYEAPLKTILVSSGMPSEGKSFIAANLAVNLARNTVNNILLIDGDLRRPTLHSLLGAPDTPGLSEYLAGTAELSEILQRNGAPHLSEASTKGGASRLTFIPSGKCGDQSSELVANHRMEQLISTLSPHFDWIIIDSPPVLAVTDAVELSRAADAVLLVARGARTPFDVAQRTQAAFSNSRILVFVLNDVKDIPRRGYNYYDYYGAAQTTAKAR